MSKESGVLKKKKAKKKKAPWVSENKNYYCAFIWTLLSNISSPPGPPFSFLTNLVTCQFPRMVKCFLQDMVKPAFHIQTAAHAVPQGCATHSEKSTICHLPHLNSSQMLTTGQCWCDWQEKEEMLLPPPTKQFFFLGSWPWIAAASLGSNSWSLDDRVNAFHCITWQPTTASPLFIVFFYHYASPVHYQWISFYFIDHLFHKIFFHQPLSSFYSYANFSL